LTASFCRLIKDLIDYKSQESSRQQACRIHGKLLGDHDLPNNNHKVNAIPTNPLKSGAQKSSVSGLTFLSIRVFCIKAEHVFQPYVGIGLSLAADVGYHRIHTLIKVFE
jgi:hypothetical protein